MATSKAKTKPTKNSKMKKPTPLIQWLLAILLVLIIASGLWTSVFANASSSTSDDAFIPVTLHTDKEADYSRDSLLYNFQAISLQIVGDILRDEDPTTVALREVAPGKGIMDYRTFLTRCERVSPDLPVFMEHLDTVEEYAEAANHIRTVAGQTGVSI